MGGQIQRLSAAQELIDSGVFSKAQLAVFVCLAAKPNELVRREELLAVIKGRSSKTIDSHIMDIRRKLRQHRPNATIETITRSGYILHI